MGVAVHQAGQQHAARQVVLYRPLRRGHVGPADLDDGAALDDQDAGRNRRPRDREHGGAPEDLDLVLRRRRRRWERSHRQNGQKDTKM